MLAAEKWPKRRFIKNTRLCENERVEVPMNLRSDDFWVGEFQVGTVGRNNFV